MGEKEKKIRAPLPPFNLRCLDPEDCKCCYGSGYMIQADKQPGVYRVVPCSAGCKPENPMTELRIPSSIQPLGGVFRLTACIGDENEVITFSEND